MRILIACSVLFVATLTSGCTGNIFTKNQTTQADDEQLSGALTKLIENGVTQKIKDASARYAFGSGIVGSSALNKEIGEWLASTKSPESIEDLDAWMTSVKSEEGPKRPEKYSPMKTETLIKLIVQARNAPAPYRTGAFQCIDDFDVCNSRREKHSISCDTALVVCFAEKLVSSYKPTAVH